jgi:hypothetical protein
MEAPKLVAFTPTPCPNCRSTNTVAVYVCPSCGTTWSMSAPRDPGTGKPIPQPCPGSTAGGVCANTKVQPVSLICNTCHVVQAYGV